MIYYLLLLMLLFNSCQDSLKLKYEKAIEHRENKEYRESNILIDEIIKSEDAPLNLKIDAHFLLAQTYLDLEYFEESIASYKNILNAPIDNPIRKKSLFMIGYIYNNNLDMYTDSKKYYNLFKDEYPKDDLIPSVDYELDQINTIIKEIQDN